MFPIPIISPLTFTRSDEPCLEPTAAISRVSSESTSAEGEPDEEYSPSQQQSSADVTSDEPEAKPSPDAPDFSHQLNTFA
jgi:hypothetical protein